jgi:hypothetical protein
MGFECRRAVRADDPQVLEPVVVENPVDVVEDQRHRLPSPELTLPAKLASRLLDPLREQASLQMSTVVRRMRDEEFRERSRWPVQRFASDGVLIEVVGRDSPESDVLLDRPVIASRGTQMKLAQCLAVRTRGRDRRSQLRFREADLGWHEQMFARGSDVSER